MALVTLPYAWAGRNSADVLEIDSNFAAVLAQVNGNLDQNNVKDSQKVGGVSVSAIAQLSVANTFTADQTIQKSNPRLVLNDTGTGGPQIDFKVGSAARRSIYFYEPSGVMYLYDGTGGGNIVGWDVSGKQLIGSVPLARMGSVVLSATSALSGNTNYVFSTGVAFGANFFKISAYCSDLNAVVYYEGCGANSATDGIDGTAVHCGIQNSQSSANSEFYAANCNASTRNLVYKVYKITES